MSRATEPRTASGLVFLAALLVCMPAITGGAFHFDDMHSVVQNPGVRSLENLPRFFADPRLFSGEPGNVMYRPVLLVTYAIDFALWGYRAGGWLLTNAIVHGLCALLVHRLALRLGLAPLGALLAALVFALHPATSEVQNYVSSRSESVAAALMLGALHVYLTARASRAGRRATLLAAAAVLSGLAILSKETTAALCAAIVWMELTACSRVGRGGVPALPGEDHVGRRLVRGIVGALPFAAVLAVALALRHSMLGTAVADLRLSGAGADEQVGGGRSVVTNLLTQMNVQAAYLGKLVAPVQLNIDYDIPIVRTLGGAALAAAFHAAWIVWALVAAARGRPRLLPLAIGWYWLFSAATLVIPLNVVMNEHRLYLPMIAVALVAGAALARVAALLGARWGAALGVALAAAPLALFVPLYAARSLEWRDDETLWTAAVERAPNSARAHMHLGAVWHERAYATYERDARVALLDRALAEYAVSDAIHPGWHDLQLNIGNAWFERGQVLRRREDFEKALAAYEAFARITGPAAARPKLLRAAALRELGRFDEALALVEAVKRENRDDSPLYDDILARILRKKGDREAAAAAMERVIARQEPKDEVDGLLDLGWWTFEDALREAAEKGTDAAMPRFRKAEGYLSRAHAIAKRTRDRRAPLYIARFLTILRQPGAAEYVAEAQSWGWTAPPHEARWVAGGPTPGVFTGTTGTKPPR